MAKKWMGLLLLAAACLLVFSGALAQELARDGAVYQITADAAYMIRIEEDAETVLIPATLDGKPVRFQLDQYNAPSVNRLVIAEGVTAIESNAFQDWLIQELVLPGTLREIKDEAFQWVRGLQTLTIPEGVERIGRDAFYSNELERIILPSTVTSINETAFAYSSALKEFIVHEDNPAYRAIDGALYSKDGKTLYRYPAGKGPEWTIPAGTMEISERAFNGWEIRRLRIGEGMEVLKGTAIADCYSLEALWLPKSLRIIEEEALGSLAFSQLQIDEGNPYFESDGYAIYQIEDQTLLRFINDTATYYDVRPGTKRIAPYAFIGKNALESVTIPRGVTAIAEGTFYNCTALQSVQLPMTLERIEESAFSHCVSLERVTLPQNLQSIEAYAFCYCFSLRALQIPDSVQHIDDGAFIECPLLTLFANKGSYAESYLPVFSTQKEEELAWKQGPYGMNAYNNAFGYGTGGRFGIVNNGNKDEKLPVYESTTKDTRVLGQFENGTTVFILDEDGDWYFAQVGELAGYIEKTRIFVIDPLWAQFTPLWGTTKESVVVRNTPLEGGAQVMVLDAGVRVEIVTAAGCWYRIQAYGLTGFVLTSELNTEPPREQDSGRFGIVLNPDCRDRLHLRAEASTSANSLGRFFNGTQVEILSTAGDWYYVNVNGMRGYMMAKFIDVVK